MNYPHQKLSLPDLFLACIVSVICWPYRKLRGEMTEDDLLKAEQRKAKKWMDKHCK